MPRATPSGTGTAAAAKARRPSSPRSSDSGPANGLPAGEGHRSVPYLEEVRVRFSVRGRHPADQREFRDPFGPPVGREPGQPAGGGVPHDEDLPRRRVHGGEYGVELVVERGRAVAVPLPRQRHGHRPVPECRQLGHHPLPRRTVEPQPTDKHHVHAQSPSEPPARAADSLTVEGDPDDSPPRFRDGPHTFRPPSPGPRFWSLTSPAPSRGPRPMTTGPRPRGGSPPGPGRPGPRRRRETPGRRPGRGSRDRRCRRRRGGTPARSGRLRRWRCVPGCPATRTGGHRWP
ncbi:hypothetical protein GA0115252_157540 [Streptomyces sp. DfronAA-171]|nr:hypothetical protein GA0115252_157540 [Streptomyces sp. DfronAA-171]